MNKLSNLAQHWSCFAEGQRVKPSSWFILPSTLCCRLSLEDMMNRHEVDCKSLFFSYLENSCFIRNISSKFAITQFWTVIAFCPILNRSHCLSFSSHLVSTISPFHVFILLECFKILYIPLLFSSSSSCFARRKDFSTEKCRSCERMKNT